MAQGSNWLVVDGTGFDCGEVIAFSREAATCEQNTLRLFLRSGDSLKFRESSENITKILSVIEQVTGATIKRLDQY